MTYEDVTPKSFPFAKEFAAILPKSTEGKIYLRNTNAMPDTKTLTHHGYLTSRLSMDSPFRAMKFRLGSSTFFLRNQGSLKLIINAMRYAPCLPAVGMALCVHLKWANFFRGDSLCFSKEDFSQDSRPDTFNYSFILQDPSPPW